MGVCERQITARAAQRLVCLHIFTHPRTCCRYVSAVTPRAAVARPIACDTYIYLDAGRKEAPLCIMLTLKEREAINVVLSDICL